MIQNDEELEVTQERIAFFVKLLKGIRIASRPDEYALVSSGYRCEIKKMQEEVLEYLSNPVDGTTAKAG